MVYNKKASGRETGRRMDFFVSSGLEVEEYTELEVGVVDVQAES